MKKRFWRVRQTPQELHYLDWAEKIKEKYFLNEEYGFAGATLTFLQGNRDKTPKNSGDERRLMLFFQNLIIYWENQVGVKITIGNERLWKQNVRIALEAALNHLTSEQEKIYFKETKLARELLEGRIKTEEQMRESRIFCRWQSGLSWEEISGIKAEAKYTDTPERIQELRHNTARQRKTELEICESRKISRQLQEEFWQNRLIYLESKELEKFPQDSNKDRPEHPQSQLVYLESKESETGSQEDKQPSWLKEIPDKQIELDRQRQTEEVTKEQIRLQKQTEEINREQIVLQKQAAEANKRQSEMERQSARDNTSDKTLSESRQEFQRESQKEFQKESQQVLQKESQKDSQLVLQEKSEEESRKEYPEEHQKEHQEHFSQDSDNDLWIEHLTESEYTEKVTGDREEALPEYDRPEHPQSQLVYLEAKESETRSQEDKQPSQLKEIPDKQIELDRQRQTEEVTKEQIRLQRQAEKVNREQIALQRQTEEVNKEQIKLQKQTEEANREQIVLQKQADEVNKRQSEMERQSARDNTSDKTLSESRQEFQKESQQEFLIESEKEFQKESQQVLQKESQKESQKDSQHVLQEKSEEESRKEYPAEHQKEHQEHQENFSQDSNHDLWIEHLTEPEYTEKVIGDREEGLPEYDRPEHPQSQLVYLESKESETGLQKDKQPSWLKEIPDKQIELDRQRQTEEVNKEQIALQRQSVRDNTSDKTFSESWQELQKEPQKESRQELQKEPQKESPQELQKESQKESRQVLQKESQKESRQEYQTEYQKGHQENFSQDSNHDLWMEHPTESEYTEKITGDREEGLPEYDRPDKEWEEKETRLEYLKSRQNESLPGSKEEFSALMKKQSEIISEIETRVLEAETRIKRNPVPEKIPEKFAGKHSERLAEQLVETYPERFAEQLVEKHPERLAEKLMEKHSERFAEQLVEKYPERFAEQLMEKHPERFAEKLAEKYPEKHTAVITNKLISEIHRRDILPVLQIRNGNIIYRYPAGRTGSPEIRFRNTHLGSPEPRFPQAHSGTPENRFRSTYSDMPVIRFQQTRSGSPEPSFPQTHSGSPEIRLRNTHLGSREPHFLQAHSGSPEPSFPQTHSGSSEIRFRNTDSGSPEPSFPQAHKGSPEIRFPQSHSGSSEFRFLQTHSKLPGSSPLLSQPQLTEGGQLYRDAKIQYTLPESRKRNQETMRSNVSALSAQTVQAQEETRVLRKQTGYTQAALAEQEKRVDGLRKELHSQIKQVNEEVKRLIDQQKSDTSVRSLTDKVMKELQKQFRTEKIRRGY